MRKFDVSKSTVLRDLDALTETTSFYTIPGNGGGIYAAEGWYASKRYLTDSQEAFLKQIRSGLQTDEEKKMMESILKTFAKPVNRSK